MDKNTNLAWIDLEMTGLDPKTNCIIEIASIVTDKELNLIAIGPVLAIKQNDDELAKMDDWNKKTHAESGLIDRIHASSINSAEAEQLSLDFFSLHINKNRSPLCGNSICTDRRFLIEHMPALEEHFHYRNLDVSSIKILAELWRPDLKNKFLKKETHQALEDIKESIAELAFYKKAFLQTS